MPTKRFTSEQIIGKLRAELLDREIFYTLREAQVLIEWWRQHCNTVRPHSALGCRPPAPEARAIPVFVPCSLPALASGVGLN